MPFWYRDSLRAAAGKRRINLITEYKKLNMMANLLRITCGKTILLTASLLWITHAFSFTHAQSTWVVCDTCAISSIQAAIDSAGVGDTINVGPGTYSEEIVLNKKDIRLFGPNYSVPGHDSLNRFAEAIIDGNIELGDKVGSGAPANGSEFKGFTVKDPGSIQTGIGSNSHDILVENNIVQGYTTGFTNALASGNVMEKTMIVRHNLFIGHVSAISTEGAHTAIIENNHFLNNRNSIGFNGNDTDSFSIQDNVFIIDNVDSLEMEFSNDARYISVRGALEGPPAEDVLYNNNNMFSPSARFLLSGDNTSHIVPEGSGSIFPVEIIRNGVAVAGFNAIQDAVNGAMAGDTIQVAPGTYEENVHIQTNDLTIISTDGAGSTSIVESGDGTMGVVAIEANGVSLIGFTIDAQVNGSNNRGVRVNRSTDGVLIKENVFNDAQLGVQGDWGSGSASNLTISENIFNSKVGIGGTEDIENLTIVNNIFNTSIEGIGIGEGVVLSGIGIQNNSFEVDSGVAIANFKMNPIAAPCNWFGTNDIDSIEMHLVTGSGTVYVRPYLIDGTDTQPAQTGFFPDADNCQNPDVVFNTTQNTSFSSIQTAINLANAGDVIQVGTGTFFEKIVIDKEGLTLVNGSWPVIDGNEGVPVHITANNVTLKGFKVTNADPDSALIWIDNVTGVTIDSNYLTNPGTVSLYGIAIDGGGEHTIVQNEIDSVAYGVAMQLSNSNQIGQTGLGNEINAVAYPTDPVVIPTGVLLFDESNENTIGYNQINSVGYGVHLADESSDNTIENNEVAGQDHGIIVRTFNMPTPSANSAQQQLRYLQNEITATDSPALSTVLKLQDSMPALHLNCRKQHPHRLGWYLGRRVLRHQYSK
jgi:parallel beta-helix repeat protein